MTMIHTCVIHTLLTHSVWKYKVQLKRIRSRLIYSHFALFRRKNVPFKTDQIGKSSSLFTIQLSVLCCLSTVDHIAIVIGHWLRLNETFFLNEPKCTLVLFCKPSQRETLFLITVRRVIIDAFDISSC